MKSTGTCPKCSSKKIGHLENVIHRTDTIVGPDAVKGHAMAPLGVSRTESKGILKVIKEAPEGELEAYFCSACGYYETYLKDSANVPYETLVGFKWRDSA